VQRDLYDTNILIDFWKKKKRDISGYTTIFNIIEFPKALLMKNLTVLYPTIDDFNEAVKISQKLMKQGKLVDVADIVVACIASRHDLTLVTTDTDFNNIKSIRPEFKVKITKQ